MRPSVPAPTGTDDPLAGARDGQAAAQTFGGAHGDGAHDAVAQLLLHFEGQVHVIELERVVDLGDLIAWKFHVDDRADDLHDFAAGCHSINLSTGLLRNPELYAALRADEI